MSTENNKTNLANLLLNGMGVVLLTLIGFMGKAMWEDLKEVKIISGNTAVQMTTVTKQVDDHETRIRQTERDVTILQQQQREDRIVRPPKLNNP